jgi:tRNA pseudouridine38-40 synthase
VRVLRGFRGHKGHPGALLSGTAFDAPLERAVYCILSEPEGVIARASFKLLLHYDGTAFHGWQSQPGLRTVQRTVEEALATIHGEPVRVHGAGRTDAGVHARGQVAHFRAPVRHTPLVLRRAVNAQLPADVWVADVRRVSPRFHARFDAAARTYRYYLGTEDLAHSPFHRPYCWALAESLETEPLAAAADDVLGSHDFGGFARHGPGSRICRVTRAAWERDPLGWRFEITADRFLRGMVRALVGAFVGIARGTLERAHLSRTLAEPRAAPAPFVAPPQGLFLWDVRYPVERRPASSTAG